MMIQPINAAEKDVCGLINCKSSLFLAQFQLVTDAEAEKILFRVLSSMTYCEPPLTFANLSSSFRFLEREEKLFATCLYSHNRQTRLAIAS